VTINQIHNVYAIPKSLEQQWAARSYHGDLQNNTRAVVNRFLGFYDGNPVNLHPLSPEDSAPLYVEMMGGGAKFVGNRKPFDQFIVMPFRCKFVIIQHDARRRTAPDVSSGDRRQLQAPVSRSDSSRNPWQLSPPLSS
jgi:hypothetical protein